MTRTEEAVAPAKCDLDALVAGNRLRGVPLRAWLILSLALSIDGFDISLLGMTAPAIAADFNLDVVDIGMLLGAQQAGMVIAGVFGGALGDRFGRRRLIAVSIGTFGILSCLAAIAPSAGLFVAARIAGGLGLGAIAPNIASYFTEVLPISWRSRLTAAAFIAMALGSIGCALAVKTLEPFIGWRGLFVVGGLAPLLIIPLVLVGLPESPAWLVSRRRTSGDIAKALNRLLGEQRCDAGMEFVSGAAARAGKLPDATSPTEFLRALPLRDTLALWTIMLAIQLAATGLYHMGPTVLSANGLPLGEAARLMVWYNVAGLVATVVVAWMLPIIGSRLLLLILGTSLLVAFSALLLYLSAAEVSTSALLWPIMLAGAGINTLSLIAFPLAANVYPTAVRATGVGVAAGIGRVGSVIAPAVIGLWMGVRGPAHAFELQIPVVVVLMVAALILRRHIPSLRVAPAGPRS